MRCIRDSFLEGEAFNGLDGMQDRLLAWLDNIANKRVHATTKECPCDLLLKENLADSRPFARIESPTARIIEMPRKGFSMEEAPVVETRPLSVYEEAVL